MSSSVHRRFKGGSSKLPEKIITVGHYKIGKTIGEGTFGKVKLGTHTITGQKVAVKILEKDRIIERADVTRVSREISILKIIRHPNVIQLYEIIETQKQLYLIMEYASHGELFEYIVSHKKVEEAVAAKFYRQIVAGIAYLHSQGIIHRDLKPENLLLDAHDNIKIVDFGLSNRATGKELLKTACGSPCYAPPEMVLGRKYKGSAADIWSSGVVLFALLCGYLPFDDPNTARLYKKITLADYMVPTHVSASAKDLISKILTIDPNVRYTIEDIRKHTWFANEGNPCVLEPGIRVGTDSIPVNFEVIERMEKNGIITDRESSVTAIRENRHNYLTTTYYLLLNTKENVKLAVDSLQPQETKSGDELKSTSFIFEETAFYKEKMEQRRKVPPASARVKPVAKETKSDSSSKKKLHTTIVGENTNKKFEKTKYEPPVATIKHIKRNSVKPPDRLAKKALAATVISPPCELIASPKRPQTNTPENHRLVKPRALRLTTPISPHKHAMTLTEDSLSNAHNQKNPFKLSAKRPVTSKLVTTAGNTPRVSLNKNSAPLKKDTYTARPKTASRRYDQVKSELKSMLNSQKGSSRTTAKPKEMATTRNREITEIIEEPAMENSRPGTNRISLNSSFLPSQTKIEARINKHKGPFDVTCISTKKPREIIRELVKVLEDQRLKYRKINVYVVNCQKQNVKFEIEVLQMEDTDLLHLVKFKRISGEQRDYKEAASSVLHAMQL